MDQHSLMYKSEIRIIEGKGEDEEKNYYRMTDTQTAISLQGKNNISKYMVYSQIDVFYCICKLLRQLIDKLRGQAFNKQSPKGQMFRHIKLYLKIVTITQLPKNHRFPQ